MITPDDLNRALRRHAVEAAQIRELTELRSKLLRLFVVIKSVKMTGDCIGSDGYRNLDEVRTKSPDQWQEYQDYKLFSIDLWCKFGAESYALLPKWMKREPISEFRKAMDDFAPFTMNGLIQTLPEDIDEYMLKIRNIIEIIDATILEGS